MLLSMFRRSGRPAWSARSSTYRLRLRVCRCTVFKTVCRRTVWKASARDATSKFLVLDGPVFQTPQKRLRRPLEFKDVAAGLECGLSIDSDSRVDCVSELYIIALNKSHTYVWQALILCMSCGTDFLNVTFDSATPTMHVIVSQQLRCDRRQAKQVGWQQEEATRHAGASDRAS